MQIVRLFYMSTGMASDFPFEHKIIEGLIKLYKKS